MPKKITKVSPGMGGHLHLDFDDHSKEVYTRGGHEHLAPQVGEEWPRPAKLANIDAANPDAVTAFSPKKGSRAKAKNLSA